MRKRDLKKKDKNRFECLQKTVTDALRELEKQKDSEHYDNVKSYLDNMKNDITKYGLLIAGNSPRIGVFGCPNRGKSTLLNVMLGVDLLPRNPIAGTTRSGIELHNKEPENIEEPYKITVEYVSKPPHSDHYTPNNAKAQLEILSSKEVNLENPDISIIKVEGPFESYIGDDIVFVDAPGFVELKTDTEEPEDHAALTHNYKGDNNHALAVLDKVDVIIFCMRYGGQYDKGDQNLYNKYLTPTEINPINVINIDFNSDDNRTERENKKNDEIKLVLKKDGYRLLPDDTVVVSSKKALDIISAPKNANKNIIKIIRAKFKDKDEDLKGFKELKDKIQRKAGIKNAAAIKERIKRYEDKYNNSRNDVEKKGIKFPPLDKSWKTGEKFKSGAGNIFGGIGKILLKILKIVKWIIIISLILLVILVILVILGAWSSWLI